NVQIQSPEQLEEAAEQIEEQGGQLGNVEFQHADFAAAAAAATAGGAVVADATAEMVGHAMSHSGPAGEVPRVGRND
ncbi:hypothetical protein ISG10_38125, partial [Burkholderia pseudomallei]|nr:hypothetical protein [Burkholderia pseudomallei]MBF3605600.1 hypothetical protein [Burkholderia pseudomallei]